MPFIDPPSLGFGRTLADVWGQVHRLTLVLVDLLNKTEAETPSETLQDAYDASTSPELRVDATRGALTIRDAVTPIAAPLLAVENNSGTAQLAASVDKVEIRQPLLPFVDSATDLGSNALRFDEVVAGMGTLRCFNHSARFGPRQ